MLLNATFATGGAITVDDSLGVAAIAALTAALEKNLSNAAVTIPGTPAANLAVSAGALNDISTLLSSMYAEQKKMNQALQLITSSLTSVSSNVATGVTTAQLSFLDQTKANKFNQETTNAALERADLPKTVVTKGTLSETVSTTVSDIADLNVQSQVAATTQKGFAFAQGLITDGLAYTYGKASAFVASTGLGKAVTALYDKIFGKVKEVTVEVNSAARAPFIGQVATKPVPTTEAVAGGAP